MGFLKTAWQKTKQILVILFLAQLLYIVVLKWFFPPITVTQVSDLLNGHGLQRDYVEWQEISSSMKLAVIASEDQRFLQHHGFDWESIQDAIKRGQKNKRIRGASTISQQVAKNVFLWNGRSWFRKGMEVYFTFMIEAVWGKQRILEVYLNVAEMGKGIFGVEAASKAYFGKHASRISRTEACQIAACLPNPKKFTVKPISSFVKKKSLWIQSQMANLGPDESMKIFLTSSKATAK